MDLSKAFSKERPLLLVGCGRMGGAMARGWLASGLSQEALFIVKPSGRPDFAPTAAHFSAISDVPRDLGPLAIVLAVKPKMMTDVLNDLNFLKARNPLAISVAAGTQLRSLTAHFDASVRAMPNTPCAIGKGMMAAVASDDVSKSQYRLATTLLAAAGRMLWVDEESQMDAVTGVSGSGPAYIFALTEALADAGKAQGLPVEIAEQLARETVIGAAYLMEDSVLSPRELREQVTSPGGTTAAALAVLRDETGFPELLRRAVKAAADRSRELAEIS